MVKNDPDIILYTEQPHGFNVPMIFKYSEQSHGLKRSRDLLVF